MSIAFLAKGSRSSMSSTETLDAGHSRRSLVSSPSEQKKKSILKKSDSGSSRSGGGGSVVVVGSGGARTNVGDPERENLLMSDPESSAAETPDVSRKRLLPLNYTGTESSATGATVALPPTQLNCDLVKSLVGPKIRTSGAIVNRGMSMADHNNHNNNGTNNALTIKFVKLPDEERQRMAASNNVNNNVLSSQQQSSVDFVSRGAQFTNYGSTRSNGMASKEIQTSSANLSTGGSAAHSGGRKFERGRDPHRQRSPQVEEIAEELLASEVGPQQQQQQQHQQQQHQQQQHQQQQHQQQPHQQQQLQCSNLNCRHNIPSSSSSSSSIKRVVCLCGNVMTVTPTATSQQQQQQQQQQPNLIHLLHGDKPFILVDSGSSDESSRVSKNPDQVSS